MKSPGLDADVAVANLLPGPLLSVEADLARLTRPGALVLLSGFRGDADVRAVRRAYAENFEVPDEPSRERDGWVMLACRRR